MKQQKKASIRLLAAALAVCLLLPLVGCGGREPQPATEVARLSKLCRVWGYVKYTHPAFLLGQKDWDAELLTLIPQVRELETNEEVNALLHEWFAGLGEIDYGTSRPAAFWAEAAEEDKVVIADTSWTTDAGYLGEDLAGDLGQLGEIPDIRRRKGPVHFQINTITEETYPVFNENEYPDMDFSDEGYRLLGLFRAWNILEYYFPYHDLLEEDWAGCLDELIPVMLEGNNQDSYTNAILRLLAKLHDSHGSLDFHPYNLRDTAASHADLTAKASFSVEEVEGKLVVSGTADDCPLALGDIILEINGMSVEEAMRRMRLLIPCSRDSAFLSRNATYIFAERASIQEPAEVTVLRDGKEESLLCQKVFVSPLRAAPPEEYRILDGNIGLINPANRPQDSIMQDLRDTDGLIIDLRQYPWAGDAMYPFYPYFTTQYVPAFIHGSPSGAVPGAYVKKVYSVGYRPGDEEQGVYHYDRPVVVLMDEFSQSASERAAWSIGKGENVVLMGQNTIGALGRIGNAPLPGGFWFTFTAIRAELDDGSQFQRVGLTPDIPVSRTIQGVTEGRDELMEAAVEYIQNQSIK